MGANTWLAIDVGTAPAGAGARAALRLGAVRRGRDPARRLGLRRRPDDRARGDRRLVAALAAPPAWIRPAPRWRRGGRRGRAARRAGRSTRWPRAAPLIHECLSAIADEAGYLIVISDADGVLLSIEGSGRVRLRAAARHELRRGHAVERARRGHERDRHRARRRPRRPGLRPRALQRARAALDVQRRADPRSRHRRAARRHRPHRRRLAPSTRTASPWPPRPPAPSRPAAARSCRSATPACTPATATAGRPARAALVTPTGRPITRPAARAGASPAGSPIPPGGGALDAAVAAPPRWPSRSAARCEAFVVRATEAAPRRRRAPAAAQARLARPRPRDARDAAAAGTELRPRLAEILALLCAQPDGLSAEALCARPARRRRQRAPACASRSRRLRKLLGPWIDTERYRLTCDVETDVRRVEGLLAARRTCARPPRPTPARCCRAPRRPAWCASASAWSAWLRQAVMTADDAEALWAWVHTAHGEDDLAGLEAAAHAARVPRPAPRLAAPPPACGELRRAALM